MDDMNNALRNTPKRKAALARKIAWNTAIAEGRVMRSQGGLSMASFATRADALDAVASCQMAGLQADIIDPSLADKDYL
jgi:hypothetical protein